MASKRVCPACHQDFIKGRRALLNARTGPRMTTVCQPCFDGGLTIVPDKTGDMEKCTACEKNPACFCASCTMKKVGAARAEVRLEN